MFFRVYFILFCISFITLEGCSLFYNSYLSPLEISKQIKGELILKKINTLDSYYQIRKKNLTPLNTFFKGVSLDLSVDSNPSSNLKSYLKRKNGDGVDWRKRDTPIKKQWGGTCSAFSGVAGMENLINQPLTIDLSERDAWDKYKKYSVKSFVSELSKPYNMICLESQWNQDSISPSKECAINRKWRLGKTKYLFNSVAKALDSLDLGYVVYLGLSTPLDMLLCHSVIREETSLAGGGHAVLVVGYHIDYSIPSGGYFIIKNSWGNDCGDNGYQYLPFNACTRKDGYCSMWEFRTVIEKKDSDSYRWFKKCKRMWYWLWLKKKCFWKKVPL